MKWNVNDGRIPQELDFKNPQNTVWSHKNILKDKVWSQRELAVTTIMNAVPRYRKLPSQNYLPKGFGKWSTHMAILNLPLINTNNSTNNNININISSINNNVNNNVVSPNFDKSIGNIDVTTAITTQMNNIRNRNNQNINNNIRNRKNNVQSMGQTNFGINFGGFNTNNNQNINNNNRNFGGFNRNYNQNINNNNRNRNTNNQMMSNNQSQAIYNNYNNQTMQNNQTINNKQRFQHHQGQRQAMYSNNNNQSINNKQFQSTNNNYNNNNNNNNQTMQNTQTITLSAPIKDKTETGNTPYKLNPLGKQKSYENSGIPHRYGKHVSSQNRSSRSRLHSINDIVPHINEDEDENIGWYIHPYICI